MQTYPLFMKLSGQPVVLVGAGEAACQKLRLLRATGAQIQLFAPVPSPDLATTITMNDTVTHHDHWPGPEHLKGAALVVAASGVSRINTGVALAAKAWRIPVNVVDRPELCTVLTPAIIDRGDIVVAISSGGTAPVLARHVRSLVERALPAGLEQLGRFAASIGGRLRALFPDVAARRRVWDEVVEGPIADHALAGEFAEAQALLDVRLDDAETNQTGKVWLVGAGPGDPELLTIKAHRSLQRADVIVHDQLVSDSVLNLARRDAERVYVGKRRGNHAVEQPDIHTILVTHAAQGKMVVRLKGGDPFVFGRGGEEMEALQAAGIEVGIIPGISAALGCAAAADIPLTHRDHASSLTLVTGHNKDSNDRNALERDDGAASAVDWRALGQDRGTVVVYMGLRTAPLITARLLAAGRPPATPVAVIENGTRPTQRVVRGTLTQLPKLVTDAAIKGPAILVIGDVAALANPAVLETAAAVAA